MWYGSGSYNPSLTVGQFITRLGYTAFPPSGIYEPRWKAMLAWYAKRRDEGLDNEEIVDMMG